MSLINKIISQILFEADDFYGPCVNVNEHCNLSNRV